jgi:hypothetical protein
MNRLLSCSLPLVTALALSGCMTAPADLNVDLRRATEHGKYVVTLQPPETAPAINQSQSWQVKVASPAGAPVTAARIAVDGGMPQHGHGLPTRPLVRRELSAGTYLLEGMKFSMTGWWEIKLALDTPQGPDKVTFNVVVDDPTTKR